MPVLLGSRDHGGGGGRTVSVGTAPLALGDLFVAHPADVGHVRGGARNDLEDEVLRQVPEVCLGGSRLVVHIVLRSWAVAPAAKASVATLRLERHCLRAQPRKREDQPPVNDVVLLTGKLATAGK